MGQPDDIHAESAADSSKMIRHSCASESSDDSFLLSGSSRDSCESGRGPPLPHSTGLQRVAHQPNPHADRGQRAHCKLCQGWSELSERQQLQELVSTAVAQPDSIRWKPLPVTINLERDSKGSLCFEYKDVKGETSGKMYTMVKRVSRDGPAYRNIFLGDCILSANGQPLDSSQGVTLRSVVSVDRTKPVCLIVQHPEAILFHQGRSGKRTRPQRSISQERGTNASSQHPHGLLERMDSGKMSTNSSHDSKPPSEYAPKSVEERLQGLLDSKDNLSCLDAHMPRLPRLQVLIAGSEAQALADSLLGGARKAETLSNDVGVCYRGSVTKTCSGFSLQASRMDLREWVVELLEAVASSRPADFGDRVELEVTALHTQPFSTYCHQILATAHTIYIVQFRCQDFLENKLSVLLDIQRRLNKIGTYASSKVPVYLVMTVESSPPSEQLSDIGQTLHLHFAGAFTNQLQYSAGTNLPCFPVVQTSTKDHSSSCSSNCDSDTEECCVLSKNRSGPDAIYSVRGSDTLSSAVNAPAPKFEMTELRDHVARAAFEQRFVQDRYPLAYLLHRERVQKLRRNGIHYAYKASIMQECSGITERDLSSLLRFLHNSGDILCADFLQYKYSSDTVCFQTTSNNILLERECLITAAKRLTTVPSRAQQQEAGVMPGSIRQWQDLQDEYTASSAFLEQLLGNEAANILASLCLVNLLHPLRKPSLQTSGSYLVPFFFPHDSPDAQPSFPFASDPNLYQLCLDFHGSMPDGVFMQVLVRLFERSWESRGRWSIEGTTTACLTLANDCEMTLVSDEVQSLIRIHARYRVTFKSQDLVVLLKGIVEDLRCHRSDLHLSVGPPCPLPAHLCKVRAREPAKAHVIDIGYGRAPVPLWCGEQQVDQHPLVTHWMIRPADIVQVTLGPRHRRVPVSLRTHIKHLPPELFNWLCNHLNVPPVDRNWQGVASALGYKVCHVHMFEVQKSSVLDPCRSLLLDWAQYASATLEALVNILDRDLQRMDILTDLQERWPIVR